MSVIALNLVFDFHCGDIPLSQSEQISFVTLDFRGIHEFFTIVNFQIPLMTTDWECGWQ